jgi:hypothetical protein
MDRELKNWVDQQCRSAYWRGYHRGKRDGYMRTGGWRHDEWYKLAVVVAITLFVARALTISWPLL